MNPLHAFVLGGTFAEHEQLETATPGMKQLLLVSMFLWDHARQHHAKQIVYVELNEESTGSTLDCKMHLQEPIGSKECNREPMMMDGHCQACVV